MSDDGGPFESVARTAVVGSGDAVRTGQGGFAEVAFHDGSMTRLDATTELRMVELADGADGTVVSTEMESGRIWSRVKERSDGRPIETETPVATVASRGTALVVDCPNEVSCTFTVLQGAVELELPDDTSVDLDAPLSVTVGGRGLVGKPTTIIPEAVIRSDKWLLRNAARDADAGFDSEFAGSGEGGEGESLPDDLCARVDLFLGAVSPEGFTGEPVAATARAVAAIPTDQQMAALPEDLRAGVEAVAADVRELPGQLAGAPEPLKVVEDFLAGSPERAALRASLTAVCL